MNISEKGSETRAIFFLFFGGQLSQDDPIIIPQRRRSPPNPMGGLSEGKGRGKQKEQGVGE